MPLKTYQVSGSVVVPVGYSISMEASSVEDAEARVRDMLLTSRKFYVTDFDGNKIDFSDDDINVDEVSDS